MIKNIVCLPGDGIGPEVMESATLVLNSIGEKYNHQFKCNSYPFGGAAIDVYEDPFPQSTRFACENSDGILLGAVGGPKWDGCPVRPEQGLLALRKALELFANVRPVEVMPQLTNHSPLKEEIVRDVDFVVVRELTGGIYFSQPKFLSEDVGTDTLTYTRAEIERVATFAFELARKRNYKVTSIDKANVLDSSKLWRSVTQSVAKQYPDVELEHLLVDAAAMEFIRRPARFDVIVTENLFGDILSDEASMITGSLGMLPSGSYSPRGPALYEPIHGSAPDIAGMELANPIGMIRSVSMMLWDFGLTKESALIESSIQRVIEHGMITKDLGGSATTKSFTEALIREINEVFVCGEGSL